MQTHIMFRGTGWTSIFVLILTIFASSALAGGGNVLPPTARPHGYSLSEMAKATAGFNTPNPFSGMRTYPYPKTPFQILYQRENLTFEVSPGTMFYVPILFIDDSNLSSESFPKM